MRAAHKRDKKAEQNRSVSFVAYVYKHDDMLIHTRLHTNPTKFCMENYSYCISEANDNCSLGTLSISLFRAKRSLACSLSPNFSISHFSPIVGARCNLSLVYILLYTFGSAHPLSSSHMYTCFIQL